MNVLILGNATDAHADRIQGALSSAGATVHYLETHLFPTQLKMSWQPHAQSGRLTLSEGCNIDIAEIRSVFWRNFSGVHVPLLNDSEQHTIAFNDSMSALRSLLQAIPARWVNSWQAYEFHKEKPLQLRQAKLLGVPIPQTLISNSAEEIINFVHSLEKAIFKPVYGGAHAKLVTDQHLEPKRLNLALSISPVTIQEYIPGTNIRSYVINQSVYSAEIKSEALDFREDNEAQLIPVELPPLVQQQCLDITREFMLEWTAIDWRLKPNGEYVFLEANPSPMFLHFEKQTGFPITQELVRLLME